MSLAEECADPALYPERREWYREAGLGLPAPQPMRRTPMADLERVTVENGRLITFRHQLFLRKSGIALECIEFQERRRPRRDRGVQVYLRSGHDADCYLPVGRTYRTEELGRVYWRIHRDCTYRGEDRTALLRTRFRSRAAAVRAIIAACRRVERC